MLIPIIQKYVISMVNKFIQKDSIYYFDTLNSKNIELNKVDIVFFYR